jgi:hypothetical protein
MKELKVLEGKYLSAEKLAAAINEAGVTPTQIVETKNGRWVCFYEGDGKAAKAVKEPAKVESADEDKAAKGKAKAATAKL